MNDTAPQNPITPARIGLLVAVALLAVIAAFVIGMAVASTFRAAQDEIVEETQDDAVDTTDEDETAADDGVAVDWDSDERGAEHPVNFYLRRWWETEMVSAAALEEYPYGYSATIIDTIEGGPYDGYYLVDNQIYEQYGIGGFSDHYYLLEQPDSDYNAIVLTRYSYSDTWRFDEELHYEIDALGLRTSDMKLAGHIDVEESLESEDGEVTFSFLGQEHENEVPPYDHVVETSSGVIIYESTDRLDGAFYFMQVDGTAVWYDADVIFWNAEEDSYVATPSIVWNDGDAVGEYMKGEVGGCGFMNPTRVVEEADLPELTVTGHAKSDSSVVIYEPTDYADVADSNEYDNWKRYMQYNAEEGADTSIEAFAAEHPTFYYEDALGRWILFMTSKAAPAAECGKPVIYLYPETTTRIDVSLAPQGGFSKSEPAYNGGWHVVAQPDGTLTNLADGLTYPYLFWEGRGGLYSAPNKYWVVARADVHTFLTTTLAKLGLNAQEMADFMEFWEPRMQGAQYYKIGFHGTSVMDQIAPMTLSETPDTVLRILMDYSELAAPIAANPPRLPPTPVRNGFTVIEWGGVIR